MLSSPGLQTVSTATVSIIIDRAPQYSRPHHTRILAHSRSSQGHDGAMQVGIVGLPNVGKSTLFNTLTKMGIPAENFPFCTIDPNNVLPPPPPPSRACAWPRHHSSALCITLNSP